MKIVSIAAVALTALFNAAFAQTSGFTEISPPQFDGFVELFEKISADPFNVFSIRDH